MTFVTASAMYTFLRMIVPASTFDVTGASASPASQRMSTTGYLRPRMLALLLLLAAIIGNLSVRGQWSLGVQAGGQYTLTSFDAADPIGLTSVEVVDGVGYVAGLEVGKRLSEQWSVTLGALFEQRTHRLETISDTNAVLLGFPVSGELTTTTRSTRSYLHVPLMLRWRPAPWFGIEGGAAGAFLLGIQQVSSGELELAVLGFNTELPFTNSSGSTAGARSARIQLAAGLAFMVHPRVDIKVSYVHDTTMLEEDDTAGSTRQRALRCSVSYAFLRGSRR